MDPIANTKGYVFNIQHYSVHDGPGIRTAVFLKGCPLRCVWCQNPESHTFKPQLFFAGDKCAGCGDCVAVCPEKAIEIVEGKSKTNRALCKGTGKCVEVCPNKARSIMGKAMTAGEVLQEIKTDMAFYKNSGGGATLSGGEPLAQPDFSIAILKLCKENGISTALETCGYNDWNICKDVLQYVDVVLYDFKQHNPAAHKKYTGVSNELILDNARKIIKEFPDITFLARITIVPGYNDDQDNIIRTGLFISGLGKPVKVHLIPYHRLGETKYERLETPRVLRIDAPNETQMKKLARQVESLGLTVVIGG